MVCHPLAVHPPYCAWHREHWGQTIDRGSRRPGPHKWRHQCALPDVATVRMWATFRAELPLQQHLGPTPPRETGGTSPVAPCRRPLPRRLFGNSLLILTALQTVPVQCSAPTHAPQPGNFPRSPARPLGSDEIRHKEGCGGVYLAGFGLDPADERP